MPTWVLSREAGVDLAEIEDYSAGTWGDAQAEAYLRELFAAFERIALNQVVGHSRPDVPPPYLVYAVGSHLIIYRQNHVAQRIEILNILHPAMDIATRIARALARMNKKA